MKITKKLRDVTPEEYSNWKRIDCCSGAVCYKCPFYNVSCCEDSVDSWVINKDMYSDKFLDQTIEVEVPDILNKEEKEYLSYVIKPFRHRIEYISKFKSGSDLRISIKMIDGDFMYFPKFVYPNMYKGLILDRKYTLEELGL